MKPQTCCCHVCKTSLNQYRREYLPCTQCNKIVCKNCFGTKWKGATWEESVKDRQHWKCPSCEGTCTCPRCKSRKAMPLGKLGVTTEDLKSHRMSHHMHHTNGRVDVGDFSVGEQQLPELHFEDFQPESENQSSPLTMHSTQKIILDQLSELIDSERRCDDNIRAMEHMLLLMKREREQLALQRERLESLTRSRRNGITHSPSSSDISTPEQDTVIHFPPHSNGEDLKVEAC